MKELAGELNGEFAMIKIVDDNDIINLSYCRDPVGVRPLFYGIDQFNNIVLSSEIKSMKMCKSIIPVTPGIVFNKTIIGSQVESNEHIYYDFDKINVSNIDDINEVYTQICTKLENAVIKRTQSDRPIGCLLSGGLDSSLVACLLARELKRLGKPIYLFSIGMEESTDLYYAEKVMKHIKENLNSDCYHFVIHFTPDQGFNAIPNVIYANETFDITTTRASVGQHLIAKYIAEHTPVKVILNGDGADEVEMGYQYTKNYPSLDEAHLDSIRLMKELHYFDVLRVDRNISHYGLEARVPFLDVEFFDYYLSLPKEIRVPIDGKEKYLIRKAFEVYDPDLLCHEVLWRRKEAFSDGVSGKKKSWFEMIQERINDIVSDEEYLANKDKYEYLTPISKESYYYRKLFHQHYDHETIVPHFWMPKWCGQVNDPSARVLKVYETE
jgi:asparagine synthase (glutamine-hydrolysing)